MRALFQLTFVATSVLALVACSASSDDGDGGGAGATGTAGSNATAGAGGAAKGGGAGAAGDATGGSGQAGTSSSGAGGTATGGSGQGGNAMAGAAGATAGAAGASAGAAGASAGAGGASAGAGGKGGAAGVGGAAGKAGSSGAAGSTVGVPTIAVGKLTGATAGEVAMVADGVALANTTMATACFKNFVLAAKWTETEGLTQAQIWDKLCSGTVTVDVDLYTGSWYENHVTKTIGYENEPGVVHMNRFFVDTAYMVADNIIHEAEGHSQGFSHFAVKATSVPYGLNDAFEACSPVAP